MAFFGNKYQNAFNFKKRYRLTNSILNIKIVVKIPPIYKHILALSKTNLSTLHMVMSKDHLKINAILQSSNTYGQYWTYVEFCWDLDLRYNYENHVLWTELLKQKTYLCLLSFRANIFKQLAWNQTKFIVKSTYTLHISPLSDTTTTKIKLELFHSCNT